LSSSSALDPTTTAVGYITSLDEDGFARIVSVFDATDFTDEEDVEQAVSSAVPTLTEEQVAAIVGFSLAFGGAADRVANPDRFYTSVAERAAERLELEKPPVVDRIARLFATRGLVRAAIAQAGLRDNVASLQRFDITTDLRPVLLEDERAPRLYSVVHRLRVDYTEAGDTDRVIEVVLDHDDLESLINRAQAALGQQRVLQATVASFGAKTWSPIEAEEIA
jgi:hypothetical protein